MNSKSPARYPIRVTANLTGLSIDTLRAWERRYQAVTPARDERGRMYGEEQIQRLIMLRNAVDRGHAIGQVASIPDTELRRLLAGPYQGGGVVDAPGATRGVNEGLRAVMTAIESFDSAAASSHLGRMAALLPIQEFVGQVAVPLMREVGDRWHEGTLTIAQEHMTSAILRNLLGGMVRPGGASVRSERMLFATLAGELHELGILVAAMLSVASGFDAVYLGPNLPALEIVDAVLRTSPRAVVLGARASAANERTSREIRTIVSRLPKRTELWLGGGEARKMAASIGGDRVLALAELAELEPHLNRLKRGME